MSALTARDTNTHIAPLANVKYFRSFIVDAVQGLPDGDEVKEAARLIDRWDGMAWDPQEKGVYDSAAYTVFRAWLPRMIELTLRDDIPQQFYSIFSSASATNPSAGANVLLNALRGKDAGVPQVYDFFNGADKNLVIREALKSAVDTTKTAYGSDMSKWLTPVTPHRFGVTTFGGVPVNTTDRGETLPVAMARGTSNHRIMFPGGGADYMDVMPPGQSGFIAPDGAKSSHYADQLLLYRDFRMKRGWLRSSDVDANATSTSTLNYSR